MRGPEDLPVHTPWQAGARPPWASSWDVGVGRWQGISSVLENSRTQSLFIQGSQTLWGLTQLEQPQGAEKETVLPWRGPTRV